MANETLRTVPTYCEYADGPCDQSFENTPPSSALFLYPSEPPQIAGAIESAVEKGHARVEGTWRTWNELDIAGQIIFCSVCKSTRFAQHIVADVTTLNFNLLFEIGFAMGLELPVLPIRDTSFIRDKKKFEEFALLDTVGYIDFQNSEQLCEALCQAMPASALPSPIAEPNFEAPLYLLKGPLNTEGEIRMMSTLKNSALRFRSYDTIETPRLSLHEVRKQVASSLGVVAHLLSPDRRGAEVHNARCALVAGLAMATGKAVLMLQEGYVPQPIDYRDVVVSYRSPAQVNNLLEPTILRVIGWLQNRRLRDVKAAEGLLQKLDIGDVAAENEIRPLRSYFVVTGQYQEAKRGHARLVVGRKGSGKTAIFYALRDSFRAGHSTLVLDLQPEGHQFTKLREIVLSKLTAGVQEHTLTAFWNLILLSEIAHKIGDEDSSWAHRDEDRRKRFEDLKDAYENCGWAESGDFSERLLSYVDKLAIWSEKAGPEPAAKQITEVLYSVPIRKLSDTVGAYVEEKENLILLVDNLDKGWPTRGASTQDILIVRTLLEATRKLQRQLDARDVSFHAHVFLRNDIYEHLVLETPDKGKDTAVTLDWADPELFKEILRRRVEASGVLDGSFEQVWTTMFDANVGTRDSFDYVLERTLMRPRDFLTFVHRAIEVAMNRGHERVSQSDLLQAEKWYSEDILQTTAFELKDVHSSVPDLLYVFLGCNVTLTKEETLALLRTSGLPSDGLTEALHLLAWFGFLGVQKAGEDRPRFAYEMRYDMNRLLAPINGSGATFVLHPAFRSALECEGVE